MERIMENKKETWVKPSLKVLTIKKTSIVQINSLPPAGAG